MEWINAEDRLPKEGSVRFCKNLFWRNNKPIIFLASYEKTDVWIFLRHENIWSRDEMKNWPHEIGSICEVSDWLPIPGD